MSRIVEGLPVSIQARLARHARTVGMDPNLVLTRFALERFLYRLSLSPHADRFVLKGGLLLLVWLGETVRPTRDVDLLGLGEITEESLREIFGEVCEAQVEPDGLEFVPASIKVSSIRPENAYGGFRVILNARIGKAHLRVQVDVGLGDEVYPEPTWVDYPALLEFPRPRLRAYRPETAIAEKLHAMVVLGAANSRMRDFFDVHVLAERESFEGDALVGGLRSTFARRRTPIPDSTPFALTSAFAAINEKQAQWKAFLRKNGGLAAPEDLERVVELIAAFLGPALEVARNEAWFPLFWPAGGPWR